MVIYKQRMKLSSGDMAFISLVAAILFLVSWYIFGLPIALVLALLVLVVGTVRMKHTRSVEKLNKNKGLFQRTLFKK